MPSLSVQSIPNLVPEPGRIYVEPVRARHRRVVTRPWSMEGTGYMCKPSLLKQTLEFLPNRLCALVNYRK
jgi:hypothetical protein